MEKVNIFRLQRNDQGTEGILVYKDLVLRTLELPWRENQRQISCIPAVTIKENIITTASLRLTSAEVSNLPSGFTALGGI